MSNPDAPRSSPTATDGGKSALVEIPLPIPRNGSVRPYDGPPVDGSALHPLLPNLAWFDTVGPRGPVAYMPTAVAFQRYMTDGVPWTHEDFVRRAGASGNAAVVLEDQVMTFHPEGLKRLFELHRDALVEGGYFRGDTEAGVVETMRALLDRDSSDPRIRNARGQMLAIPEEGDRWGDDQAKRHVREAAGWLSRFSDVDIPRRERDVLRSQYGVEPAEFEKLVQNARWLSPAGVVQPELNGLRVNLHPWRRAVSQLASANGFAQEVQWQERGRRAQQQLDIRPNALEAVWASLVDRFGRQGNGRNSVDEALQYKLALAVSLSLIEGPASPGARVSHLHVPNRWYPRRPLTIEISGGSGDGADYDARRAEVGRSHELLTEALEIVRSRLVLPGELGFDLTEIRKDLTFEILVGTVGLDGITAPSGADWYDALSAARSLADVALLMGVEGPDSPNLFPLPPLVKPPRTLETNAGRTPEAEVGRSLIADAPQPLPERKTSIPVPSIDEDLLDTGTNATASPPIEVAAANAGSAIEPPGLLPPDAETDEAGTPEITIQPSGSATTSSITPPSEAFEPSLATNDVQTLGGPAPLEVATRAPGAASSRAHEPVRKIEAQPTGLLGAHDDAIRAIVPPRVELQALAALSLAIQRAHANCGVEAATLMGSDAPAAVAQSVEMRPEVPEKIEYLARLIEQVAPEAGSPVAGVLNDAALKLLSDVHADAAEMMQTLPPSVFTLLGIRAKELYDQGDTVLAQSLQVLEPGPGDPKHGVLVARTADVTSLTGPVFGQQAGDSANPQDVRSIKRGAERVLADLEKAASLATAEAERQAQLLNTTARLLADSVQTRWPDDPRATEEGPLVRLVMDNADAITLGEVEPFSPSGLQVSGLVHDGQEPTSLLETAAAVLRVHDKRKPTTIAEAVVADVAVSRAFVEAGGAPSDAMFFGRRAGTAVRVAWESMAAPELEAFDSQLREYGATEAGGPMVEEAARLALLIEGPDSQLPVVPHLRQQIEVLASENDMNVEPGPEGVRCQATPLDDLDPSILTEPPIASPSSGARYETPDHSDATFGQEASGANVLRDPGGRSVGDGFHA